MPLSDRAINVLALLDVHLPVDRPLIFVCHSSGGLLVKELLRNALTTTPQYTHLARSTKLVVFERDATPTKQPRYAQTFAAPGTPPSTASGKGGGGTGKVEDQPRAPAKLPDDSPPRRSVNATELLSQLPLCQSGARLPDQLS